MEACVQVGAVRLECVASSRTGLVVGHRNEAARLPIFATCSWRIEMLRVQPLSLTVKAMNQKCMGWGREERVRDDLVDVPSTAARA
jgi:hypothetical protein